MSRSLTVAAACALALVVVPSAYADTVQITSGNASLYWDGSLTSFTISNADSRFVSEYHAQAPTGFNGGTTVNLSTTIPVTNDGNHSLAETYHGRQYQAWLVGSLTISATPFLAPPANGDGSTFRSFSTPFRASGRITAYPTSDRSGTPLFEADIIGGGTISSATYRMVGNQYVIYGGGGEMLSFQAQSWLPAPWQSQDIGDVGLAGYAYQGSDGDLFFGGSGSDIWGTADSFRYVYQPLAGDGEISAMLYVPRTGHPYAKTGLMLRQSTDPSSPHVLIDVKPDGGLEFMTRQTAGGATTFVAGGSVPVASTGSILSVFVKLSRAGGTVTGIVCPHDRVTCSPIGSTPWMTGAALVGAAVTSHDQTALNNSSVPADMPTVTANALPSPWTFGDIGDVGMTGRASQSNGTFSVSGAGSDIWGDADSFGWMAQPIDSTTQLRARVVSEQNTNMFAKAGLAMGGLDLSSARVVLDVKPDGGVEFMARLADGTSMSYLAGSSVAFPSYLWLARNGDQVDAYTSVDGVGWTPVGRVNLTLPSTAYGGLAVTSHDRALLNTAVFDHVTVGPGAAAVGSNLLTNGGFEQSTVPGLSPAWVSDSVRQTAAASETANPHSGARNGACRTAAQLDCGLYQDVVVPTAGTYQLTLYADTSHPSDTWVGWNVNGVTAASAPVAGGGYVQTTFTHQFNAGDTVRVWLYSGNTPGWAVIDDVVLTVR